MLLLKDTTCCDESSDCEVIEPVDGLQIPVHACCVTDSIIIIYSAVALTPLTTYPQTQAELVRPLMYWSCTNLRLAVSFYLHFMYVRKHTIPK